MYQLELRNVSKRYGDLKANDCVNLALEIDSIHGLLGENGSGKSTLVSIMYGLIERDAGEIFWQGKRTEIHSPVAARAMGIGVAFQHFSLFQALTVTENIALGIGYKGRLHELQRHVETVSQHYGLSINQRAVVARLSAGEKQRIEIIRCLLQKPKLLILDEPTSVLTSMEIQRLFKTLRQLRAEGCTILFISHKLDEIKELCDSATVLRKGRCVDGCDVHTMSVPEIAAVMVGKQVSAYIRRKAISTPAPVMEIEARNDSLHTLAPLQLKSGCITGIAGIAGNGQERLLELLAGEDRGVATVRFNGQNIHNWTIPRRNRAGILFVPAERIGRATIAALSLTENCLLNLANRASFVRGGMICYPRLRQFCSHIIEQFDVRAPDARTLASRLSGGNLQKFVIGRAVLQAPKVLLVSNPTWGVDVAAAIFIRNQLIRLRDARAAILVASEDLDELFAICDEIAVIKRGTLSAARPVTALSTQSVGLLMTQ